MNSKTILLLLIFFGSTIAAEAQHLLRPIEAVNRSKDTYLTMEDGSEISGRVKGIDRKKGLIEEIKIEVDGKKKVIPMDDIKFAYIPQNSWDKFAQNMNFFSDATQWEKGIYDAERVKEGYALFEKSQVKRKKKEFTALLQLLNPHACDQIKVYHDPLAKETAGLGVGGVQVTGGDDKSYFVRINEGGAFRVMKKNYKDYFKELFGSCNMIVKKFGQKIKWKEFETTLFDYEGNCDK